MILSRLIKRGGLAGITTATTATPATQGVEGPATVAQVATVAVAEQLDELPELSSQQEGNIRTWLAHIDETDSGIIAEVVDKCRFDLAARKYVLKLSQEMSRSTVDH